MFGKLKIRCSSLGAIMTDPKIKSETLSETAKDKLVEIYINEVYGRDKFIINKQIQKGLQCEDDSITLLSRINKRFFKKNEEKFQNDFIIGTPDILDSDTVRDTKTSWDIFTFFKNDEKKLNKDYYWQVQGYMALTGAKKAYVDFCLVNTPQPLLDQEKYQLERKLGLNPDNEVLIAGFQDIERLGKYDDIPIEHRIISIPVDRNEKDIDELYSRIAICRQWMNTRFGNRLPVMLNRKEENEITTECQL